MTDESPQKSPSPAGRPTISVVVPTYCEAQNLPLLIDRIGLVRSAHDLDLDLLIMDDDSGDGSVELVAARPETWVNLVVRTADHGLSAAVLDGFRRSRGDVIICMDGDLSHPPEAIPTLLGKIADGADFVVGSRYVPGGTTADDWGVLRWLNSQVATVLAMPLTHISDPMAGFFAVPRATFAAGRDFNPIGYKIGLEFIVKCSCERVVEIPINFANRRFGESKLTFWRQVLYLRHLRRLYIHKFGAWSQLLQFAVVGAVGAVVNLSSLELLISAGVPLRWAAALAIAIAVTTNFMLNRRFSFQFARLGAWWKQYPRFVAASSIGALINYAITLHLLQRFPALAPPAAAAAGILGGLGFNFMASRYLVFRARHVRAT